MKVLTDKQAVLVAKLYRLAGGNYDLVRDAIESCSMGRTRADLSDVVDFIVVRRMLLICAQE